MGNRANKTMRKAVVIGLAAAALIIAAACLTPALCVNSLKKSCLPLLESSITLAKEGEFEEAVRLLEEALDITLAYHERLRLFFDHNIAAALEISVRTACDLADLGEGSQLIAEIDSAMGSLEFLSGITELGLGELF